MSLLLLLGAGGPQGHIRHAGGATSHELSSGADLGRDVNATAASSDRGGGAATHDSSSSSIDHDRGAGEVSHD